MALLRRGELSLAKKAGYRRGAAGGEEQLVVKPEAETHREAGQLAVGARIGSSTQNSNGQRRLQELWDSYPQCNAPKVDGSHGTVDALRRLNALSGDTHNRLYKIAS
ncbi:hypothetical protein UY3_13160 [Chelonia mydas]|uniref:Uncharacterized protein n=1 Tax=Chelonia mydas TaxID=8469 RepID=M7BND1_CHEMY|nr:hypothetical protein UY3_13160 [Chelonia mydas]